jgi:hypothetical protein
MWTVSRARAYLTPLPRPIAITAKTPMPGVIIKRIYYFQFPAPPSVALLCQPFWSNVAKSHANCIICYFNRFVVWYIFSDRQKNPVVGARVPWLRHQLVPIAAASHSEEELRKLGWSANGTCHLRCRCSASRLDAWNTCLNDHRSRWHDVSDIVLCIVRGFSRLGPGIAWCTHRFHLTSGNSALPINLASL